VTSQDLSFTDKERLLDGLLAVRALHDPDLRNLYVTELEAHLGRALNLSRFPDARHDLLSVVNACVSCTGGLRSFVRIIRGFHGDSAPVATVERLVDDLGRGMLLATGDRAELCHLLRGLDTDDVAAVFHEFFEPPALVPQMNWDDLPAVVRRLESLPAAEGAASPLLVFVDRLAHAADAKQSLQLHRWSSLVSRGLSVSESTQRALCVESKRRSDEGRSPVGSNNSPKLASGPSEVSENPTKYPHTADPKWSLPLVRRGSRPGGGVVEVEAAGAVEGVFRAAGVQAVGQDGVLVAVVAG
jgi:hypothetical protein